MQRVLLFSRLLIYMAIFQHLILALAFIQVCYLIIIRTSLKWTSILLVSTLYIGVSTYTFYKKTNVQEFSLYESFDKTSQFLYQKKANHIFVNVYEYSLCIRFLFETNRRTVEIDTNYPIDGATYNYLVIHTSRPFPSQISPLQYEPVYRDKEATIYRKHTKATD
jgi:hypothetical protein